MNHKQVRIVSIIVGSILGLVLIVFSFGTISKVFTHAEDAAPRDVILTDITTNSAKVTWTTGEDNQGVIEYGTSPTALNFFAPESQKSRSHSLDLTLLTPNTTYYLQIRIGDKKYDNGGVPWTFVTKSQEKGAAVNSTDTAPTKSAAAPTASAIEPSPTPTPISSVVIPAATAAPTMPACTETDCTKIKEQIGKGCTAQDYVKCIKK